MPSTIAIVNGPNLNMLGIREPEVYGLQTLDDIRRLCESCADSLSLKTEFWQSNNEGDLIKWVQDAGSASNGLIINPAGFGHTSIALMDALLSIKIPKIEVHLSNIYRREEFRRHTYTARAVNGVITGMGSYGYPLAIYALNEMFKNPPKAT